MSEAESTLRQWFDVNNPGGHDFSKPPPQKLLVAHLTNIGEDDADRIEYLMRKPNRIFETFSPTFAELRASQFSSDGTIDTDNHR